MSETCDHEFAFQGTVFSFSERCNPGGSGRNRILEDVFYCRKCLEYQYINIRIDGTNYSQPIAGTLPK